MFSRLKKTLLNCPSKLQLKKKNQSLIYKNFELVDTIEELRLKISEWQEYYLDLLTINNELLAKLNQYKSTSSLNLNKFHKFVETEDSLSVEEVNHPQTYFDSLTSRIVPLDENEELKKINEITSKYYPVPIEEDDNNVVIRYHRFDEALDKMVRNTISWKDRLSIAGERYYLVIQSHKEKRVWEITLMRYFAGSNMPPLYRLKAVTNKDEEFEDNEAIVTGDTQSISLLVELEEGEGLKFEVYPEPDDYVARTFWFY